MKQCPVCTTVLELAHRDGIEIDYCSRCRGVWLDRGELEKLIERTSSYARSDDDDDDHDQYRRRSGEGTHGYVPQNGPPPAGYSPPKKEGFFSRLFDFD